MRVLLSLSFFLFSALVAHPTLSAAAPTVASPHIPSSSLATSDTLLDSASEAPTDPYRDAGYKREKREMRAVGEGAQEKRMKREVRKKKSVSKRCFYIGTFFHLIDCNAPANSTSIPYALPVSSSPSSVAGSTSTSEVSPTTTRQSSRLETVSRRPTAVSKGQGK